MWATGAHSLRAPGFLSGGKARKCAIMLRRERMSVDQIGRLISASLVVGPHAQHVYGVFFGQHLVDEPMLDIDAARVAASQIADEFLVSWRRGERIFCDHIEQGCGFRFQPAVGEFFRVLLGLS